jgi:hypothetical protein
MAHSVMACNHSAIFCDSPTWHGFHTMYTYAVSHARSRTVATGVAEYYFHVQTGL